MQNPACQLLRLGFAVSSKLLPNIARVPPLITWIGAAEDPKGPAVASWLRKAAS